MSDFVNAVREKVSNKCCVRRCQKVGCKVPLSKELNPFVLIDMDQPCSPSEKNGKRCDLLFFSGYEGKDWVVPMELQKGKASASKIVPQLQAGASIAEKLVPKGENLEFRPVAAYGGDLRRNELNVFRQTKVKFRQKHEFVRLVKCGTNLTQALHSTPHPVRSAR